MPRPAGRFKKIAVIFFLSSSAFVISALLLFFALDLLFPFPVETLRREPTAVITDRDGGPLRFFLPQDKRWRFPIKLADVSPRLIEAVIASEDRWFHSHPGVNPFALMRAFYTNIKEGRVVS
ncbi:MAG TPA: transglycosylase domain-containing protein, partial [Thermodesulfobacteriota bacterium]|nr:transglycosylase domain-containing protein [Thermodesulfobacteriota bacterium]